MEGCFGIIKLMFTCFCLFKFWWLDVCLCISIVLDDVHVTSWFSINTNVLERWKVCESLCNAQVQLEKVLFILLNSETWTAQCTGSTIAIFVPHTEICRKQRFQRWPSSASFRSQEMVFVNLVKISSILFSDESQIFELSKWVVAKFCWWRAVDITSNLRLQSAYQGVRLPKTVASANPPDVVART
jgi:hypothetical protein